MNENLAEMVKDTISTPTQPHLVDVKDLSDEIKPNEEDIVIDESKDENVIQVTNLLEWFNNNTIEFDNLKPVNVKIQDGDPNNLILSVQNFEGKKNSDGNISRVVCGFENAHKISMLNLQATAINIFKNNNFRVLHSTNIEDVYIKCYSVNNGLISIFCTYHNDLLIPYVIKRIKRKEKTIDIIKNENQTSIASKLDQNADLEALQLLYKQSSRVIENFSTNKDVIEWLLDRQKEIFDINHLLQIDNLIIDILKD